jgi:hypothetical protein
MRLALLDDHPTGHLAPMLRAERDLARARLAVRDGGPDAAAAFTAAISSLREQSTPYQLAHGLLDHAWYLTRLPDAGAAARAAGEARDIVGRLRCQPLLDRAADLTRSTPGTGPPSVTPPGPDRPSAAARPHRAAGPDRGQRACRNDRYASPRSVAVIGREATRTADQARQLLMPSFTDSDAAGWL